MVTILLCGGPRRDPRGRDGEPGGGGCPPGQRPLLLSRALPAGGQGPDLLLPGLQARLRSCRHSRMAGERVGGVRSLSRPTPESKARCRSFSRRHSTRMRLLASPMHRPLPQSRRWLGEGRFEEERQRGRCRRVSSPSSVCLKLVFATLIQRRAGSGPRSRGDDHASTAVHERRIPGEEPPVAR